MIDVGLILAALLALAGLLLRAWKTRPVVTQIDRFPEDKPVRPRPEPPEDPNVPQTLEDNQRTRDRLRALRARAARLRADAERLRGGDQPD